MRTRVLAIVVIVVHLGCRPSGAVPSSATITFKPVESKERKPSDTQGRAWISREAITAYDPAVSLPWLDVAISHNERDLIMVAWLTGNNGEMRKAALRFLLAPETESPGRYQELLGSIAGELDLRRAEVREVASMVPGRTGNK
jgi:hypothetical protein